MRRRVAILRHSGIFEGNAQPSPRGPGNRVIPLHPYSFILGGESSETSCKSFHNSRKESEIPIVLPKHSVRVCGQVQDAAIRIRIENSCDSSRAKEEGARLSGTSAYNSLCDVRVSKEIASILGASPSERKGRKWVAAGAELRRVDETRLKAGAGAYETIRASRKAICCGRCSRPRVRGIICSPANCSRAGNYRALRRGDALTVSGARPDDFATTPSTRDCCLFNGRSPLLGDPRLTRPDLVRFFLRPRSLAPPPCLGPPLPFVYYASPSSSRLLVGCSS